MSAPELQACLARLYVDASFRRLLHVDPAFVFSRYALDAEERDALAALDPRKLDFFADTLRAKRRDKILAVYPRLWAAAAEAVDRCFDRFHELYTPHLEQTSDDERLSFGTFVAATLESSADVPAWLADVARFERMEHEVRVAREPRRRGIEGMADDDLPQRAPGTACGVFRCPIVEVVHALDEGRRPEPALRETFLILRNKDAFYVTAAVWRLYERCDGRTPLREIAGGDAGARAALRQLAAQGFLC